MRAMAEFRVKLPPRVGFAMLCFVLAFLLLWPSDFRRDPMLQVRGLFWQAPRYGRFTGTAPIRARIGRGRMSAVFWRGWSGATDRASMRATTPMRSALRARRGRDANSPCFIV
jgi:hypothetical protein